MQLVEFTKTELEEYDLLEISMEKNGRFFVEFDKLENPPIRKARVCFVCAKHARYGYSKPGIYCHEHKLENMLDVYRHKCVAEDCTKFPVFGKPGKKSGTHCKLHKTEDMVNVVLKTCIICSKPSKFVFENKRYCDTHKPENSVCVSKQAIFCAECNKLAQYGKKGCEPVVCKTHKKPGMIKKGMRCCEFEDCNIYPTFNLPGNKLGVFCSAHKQEDMVNVISKKCATHLCDTLVSKKYDGYCLRCFVFLFPEKKNSRNYKTKEQSVADFVKNKFPEMPWVFDKITGESRRRPDILANLESHVIIIEVDENQHAGESYSCENKRTMQISLDLNHKPIVFIRFNPDKYGKTPGCWKKNKSGICVVSHPEQWQQRLDKLATEIKYWATNTTEKTIETVYMFYEEN